MKTLLLFHFIMSLTPHHFYLLPNSFNYMAPNIQSFIMSFSQLLLLDLRVLDYFIHLHQYNSQTLLTIKLFLSLTIFFYFHLKYWMWVKSHNYCYTQLEISLKFIFLVKMLLKVIVSWSSFCFTFYYREKSFFILQRNFTFLLYSSFLKVIKVFYLGILNELSLYQYELQSKFYHLY